MKNILMEDYLYIIQANIYDAMSRLNFTLKGGQKDSYCIVHIPKTW
jgi:hypothetical protein